MTIFWKILLLFFFVHSHWPLVKKRPLQMIILKKKSSLIKSLSELMNREWSKLIRNNISLQRSYYSIRIKSMYLWFHCFVNCFQTITTTFIIGEVRKKRLIMSVPLQTTVYALMRSVLPMVVVRSSWQRLFVEASLLKK